jgi:hypothetical protein
VDEHRFDDIIKALGAQMNRRLSFGAFLGGTLGVLGYSQMGAARSDGCKPDCGECHVCKKGPCKSKHGKKRCKPGRCEAKAVGAACSVPADGACQADGVCSCPGGKELCKGTCYGLCPLGQQRDPSACVCCKSSGTGPCTVGNDANCCSGFCTNSNTPPYAVCL